jgi:ElaB/YqjD/DUF883 family membrane-anchored ribosome-binding protein
MNPSDTTNPAADHAAFDEMRQRFEQVSSQWKEQASQYADQAKAWIVRYPGTSLAVAAGAGLLLGLLVKRR